MVNTILEVLRIPYWKKPIQGIWLDYFYSWEDVNILRSSAEHQIDDVFLIYPLAECKTVLTQASACSFITETIVLSSGSVKRFNRIEGYDELTWRVLTSGDSSKTSNTIGKKTTGCKPCGFLIPILGAWRQYSLSHWGMSQLDKEFVD